MAGLQADVGHVQRGDAPQMSQAIDVAAVTGVVHAVDVGLAVPTHQVLLGRHQGHGQGVVVGVGDGEIEEDGREPRVLAVERDERAEGFQPHLHRDGLGLVGHLDEGRTVARTRPFATVIASPSTPGRSANRRRDGSGIRWSLTLGAG